MISLRDVKKEFSKSSETIKVLDGIDLEINRGDFVTIFGPNGSGKTTLLNIVSGLEAPRSGEVRINGKHPGEAKVGVVFQNFNESLFPWRTVLDNVVFPLEVAGIGASERMATGMRLLESVGLGQLKDSYVYEISGGQRQLVSICRAIAYDPDVLIMDEPFSALDYSTTRQVELELLDIWQEKKITTLFVSHDIDEAIFLADRVVIFSPRPARIKKVFEVALPRPRTLSMLKTPEFAALRAAVLDTFEYES